MLVLFETPGGLALFNVLDEGKVRNVDDLWKSFQTQSDAQKMCVLTCALGAEARVGHCARPAGWRRSAAPG